MNHEKAKEFFSAYHEGTLENGLRQSLEQKLKADAQLQAEYAAFQRTMEELGQLKYEQIEVPSYLSDRIATRLEHVQQQPKTPLLYIWLPRISVAAVAAAAVIGAVINLNTSSGNVATGSAIDLNNSEPSFAGRGADVKVTYQPASAQKISVTELRTGEVHEYRVDHNRSLRSTLHNGNPNAALFSVRVEGEKSTNIVAVPGTQADAKLTGTGTLTDLALAAAGHYRSAVLVTAADSRQTFTWTFEGTDARASVAKVLENGYTVEVRPENLITISER